MKSIKLLLILLALPVLAWSQDPATDQMGGGGFVYLDAAPTWTRSATSDARHSWDTVAHKLYYNDELDGSWTEFTGTGLSPTLADGSIFIGNGSNVATAQTVTGALAITNAGVTTLTASAISDQANGADLSISSGAIQWDYDFTELSDLGTTPNTGDEFIIRQVSGGAYVSVTYNDLVSGLANNFANADLTAAANRAHTINDNSATSMAIGSVGATSMINFNTTNGSEAVEFGNAITVTGTSTFNGDVVLGNASGDALTIASENVTFSNIQGFASVSAAETALGVNVFYYFTAANTVGMPTGVTAITTQ